MNRPIYAIGIDPGLASVGVSVVRITRAGLQPVAAMVIRTQKAARKRRVRAADDNFERIITIAGTLREVVDAYKPVAVCAESMSWPRNAANAAKMALCWGAMAALIEARGLPVVQISPQELKLALTGKRNATKEEVEAALCERFGAAALNKAGIKDIPRFQQEHAIDALAAVVASEGAEVIRMARQMVHGTEA